VARPAAQERLGRLLAIVPWVASRDGPLISEVCTRFGLSERELLADLDLLFMCGVHPFTPDTLIEVDVADGRVWIRFADWFRRPLRLTAAEGLALVSAGAALLASPGSDPAGALSRALAKLEAVLGVGADDAVEVDLGPVSASVLGVVQQAESEHRKVELDYYSFGRDGRSTRTVAPWRVFNAGGQWYMSGWCDQAGGERLFRVDRIHRATLSDERFQPPAQGQPPPVYHPSGDDPLYVIDLQPAAHWVASQYPNEGVESRAGGVLRIRLRASGRAWLERLLLRAGPDARVVEGDPGVAPAAARRILTLYGDAGAGAAASRSRGTGR
jgi:proteasome accessory factor C